jgi:hypothetical protein
MVWSSGEGGPVRAVWSVLAGLALLAAGCGQDQANEHAHSDSSLVAALNDFSKPPAPVPPKVPFGNQPCQSVTPAEATSLGVREATSNKADRAPANLPYDNVCTYYAGGSMAVQVGYQAEIDYQANQDGNHSTSRADPTDLPGAFYDRQGGLWFTKNGYYVVISGESAFRDKAARLIAGKL